jgi:hypothetical protein
LRRDFAPVYTAEVENKSNASWHRLWVRLVEHGPVERLTVEIIEPRFAWFVGGQNGVDGEGNSGIAVFDPPGLNDRSSRRIEWDSVNPPGTIRLRISSHGPGGETWVFPANADIPHRVIRGSLAGSIDA